MDKNNEIPVLAKVGQTEKPLFGGFSKLFYETEDPEVLRVVFKDVMHGRGKERKIEGTGRLREEFCFWFYRVLEREGIRTHIAEKIGYDCFRIDLSYGSSWKLGRCPQISCIGRRGRIDSFPCGVLLEMEAI